MTDQWIDLFKAGDYREKGKGEFSQKDLQQIVDNYDPAEHEAPATIGHVDDEATAPAYGWFDKLRVVGNKLQGKMRQVVPAFEKAVAQGMYKKRSVGLYNDSKGWSLRHVAFLGGQIPEVKGLADIQFEAKDRNLTVVEFEEEGDVDENKVIEGVMEKLWKRLFGEGGKPAVAAATFSEEQARQLAAEAAKAAVAEAVKPLQEQIEAQKNQFSERETKLVTSETKSRAASVIAKLKAEGKWVPAFEKAGLVAVFEELAASATTVDFAEKDGEAAVKKPVLDLLANFMDKLPRIVPNGEVWGGQQAGAMPISGQGDPNSARLTALARDYAKANKVSFSEAVDVVAAQNPNLLLPGGATAGAV